MEPVLRGILEQVIDNELRSDMLESNYRIFTQFKNRGLVESVPSAMFGRNYTRAYAAWLEYKASHGKDVNQYEATELGRIFEARAIEIKSKFMNTTNI